MRKKVFSAVSVEPISTKHKNVKNETALLAEENIDK